MHGSTRRHAGSLATEPSDAAAPQLQLLLESGMCSWRTATPPDLTGRCDPGGAALAALATDPRTTGHHRALTAAPALAPVPHRRV